MFDLKWSGSEKAIARKVFDHALQTELRELVQETKAKVAKIEEASELWSLESRLTKSRLEINRKYDYRYSVIPMVFANLLRQRRITRDDLDGLAPDKIDLILRAASF